MPTRDDYIYAACAVDTEGHIYIAKHSDKSRASTGNMSFWYSAGVRIQMIDPVVTPWLQKTFGGGLFAVDNGWRSTVPINRWTIMGKRAQEFLRAIFPHLKLKKAEAREALRFLYVQNRWTSTAIKSKPAFRRFRERQFNLIKQVRKEAKYGIA